MTHAMRELVAQGLVDREQEKRDERREQVLMWIDCSMAALHPRDSASAEQVESARVECIAMAKEIEPSIQWDDHYGVELYRKLLDLA